MSNKLFDLSSTVGRSVRINRGGPESIVGKMLAVKPDHLVLQNEEGIVYIKTEHIKSISLDSKDYADILPPPDDNSLPQFIDQENFVSVLSQMEDRWVQINRRGPDKVEGILTSSDNEMCVLASGNEIVHVMNFHIRNISYAVPKQDDGKQKEQRGEEQQKDKQGDQGEAKK